MLGTSRPTSATLGIPPVNGSGILKPSRSQSARSGRADAHRSRTDRTAVLRTPISGTYFPPLPWRVRSAAQRRSNRPNARSQSLGNQGIEGGADHHLNRIVNHLAVGVVAHHRLVLVDDRVAIDSKDRTSRYAME